MRTLQETLEQLDQTYKHVCALRIPVTEIRKERERLASAAAINTLAKAIHKRIIECQQRLGNL